MDRQLNEKLKVLMLADMITSPYGNIEIDAELRVELWQAFNARYKRIWRERKKALLVKPVVDDKQIDFVEEQNRPVGKSKKS